jgi:DNA-binding NarL/FixJ family response regulator
MAEAVAATETVRTLLVVADDATADRVAAAVAESADRERFALDRSRGLTAALESLARAPAGVVVLALPLPRHQGLRPLVELQAAAPTVPVVVLCAAADEPLALRAVQLGARDYLLTERLYGTLVGRSLLHAVESERVRASLSRHQREWQPLFAGSAGGARAASLRAALPERFASLAAAYGELLDRAVEQALSGAAAGLDETIQRLAREAAQLRASPRDVVELHATAMKAREMAQGPQRMKLYVAEGRVRLLELMGYLAGTYRELWLASGRGG